MKYNVYYSCVSHVGNCRSMNQDNFICDGRYMDDQQISITFPLTGCLSPGHSMILGVFDGMGGETCGDVAAMLAAREAASVTIMEKPVDDLLTFCQRANEKICQYAGEHEITAMGTTAALLAFTNREIALCNIGDSKIFRLADKKLEQVSVDHVGIAAYGRKPPLSQNLGIAASEMVIEPYVALGQYNDKDIYLICSDGLTDMLSQEEITSILLTSTFDDAINKLLEEALANGGKDNITIILCRIERERSSLGEWLFKMK